MLSIIYGYLILNENIEQFELITNQDDLHYLVRRIDNGPLLAKAFKFQERNLFISLLEQLKVDVEEFHKKYAYFDKKRNLHISESEFKYVWISTYGMVARGKQTDNNMVNACLNQYTVVSLLVDKAIEVSSREDVYDIDGYSYGCLSSLSPALFNNILFYMELFGKAYLTLSGANVPWTHKLTYIYSLVSKTMSDNGHSNTFLNVLIHDAFQDIIDYVSSIPGDFKEQFVKYDGNSEDSTLIIFDADQLLKMKNAVDFSNDFVFSYYYQGESAFELKPGALERLISQARTKKEKQYILERYGHLNT